MKFLDKKILTSKSIVFQVTIVCLLCMHFIFTFGCKSQVISKESQKTNMLKNERQYEIETGVSPCVNFERLLNRTLSTNHLISAIYKTDEAMELSSKGNFVDAEKKLLNAIDAAKRIDDVWRQYLVLERIARYVAQNLNNFTIMKSAIHEIRCEQLRIDTVLTLGADLLNASTKNEEIATMVLSTLLDGPINAH